MKTYLIKYLQYFKEMHDATNSNILHCFNSKEFILDKEYTAYREGNILYISNRNDNIKLTFDITLLDRERKIKKLKKLLKK